MRLGSSNHGNCSTLLGSSHHTAPLCCRAVDLRTQTREQLEHLCSNHLDVSSAEISVIGTGANELEPSFILNCPSRSYFFNHGEGWKRMIENFKIRLPEERVSFFTQACWENVAGSCSVYFSQTKHRHQPLNQPQGYCGPQKMKYYINYIEHFTGRASWTSAQSPGFNGHPATFEDENVKVSIIDLKLSTDALSNSIVAYSCKLADWGGQFSTDKASKFGFLSGQALKALLSGRSVITESGELVHPSRFMTGAERGPTFLVVDCPNMEVAKALTSNRYLEPEGYKGRGESVALIVHMTPLEVLQSEQYCEWVAGFGVDIKHLLLHASVCPGEVSYRTAMSFSLPLHLMNPNVYQLPCVPDKNHINKAELNLSEHVADDSVIISRPLMKYHLKPSLREERSLCYPPIQEQVLKDLSYIKSDKKVYDRILCHRHNLSIQDEPSETQILSSLSKSKALCGLTDPKDIQVTFLGTSSSHPTRVRGVSAILLQTLSDGNILLDCGEGTLGQLDRLFGRTAADDVLRNLSAIFISHMHIDHHFGLIGLLNRIQQLSERDNNIRCVKLLAHKKFRKVLERYSRWCDHIQFEKVDSEEASRLPFPIGDGLTLQTVPVRHIKHSYGIIVRRTAGWSIVYSGDTMPCEDLVQAGRNATLLIHEATQGDDNYQGAKAQKHSTYREAIMVGKVMNAGFTILTHFSRRFVKYPLTIYEWPQRTAPAVDFMSFRLSDLQSLKLDSPSCRGVLKQIGVSRTVQNALEK